jgi:hypothetical protein
VVQDLCRAGDYKRWTTELGQLEYVIACLSTTPFTNFDIDKGSVSVTIPRSTPSGDYLLRIEHIALHQASNTNGAQFYISCAQIRVTGGGNGNPSPLVSFPGAYSPNDPGIKINIYSGARSYTPPGPAVWTG